MREKQDVSTTSDGETYPKDDITTNTVAHPIQPKELVLAIHPKVLDAASATITEAKARGIGVVCIHSGLRTVAQQQKLYDQGRTDPGIIVTNAKPYESWHNFGLAIDLVFKDSKGNWTWDKSPVEWDQLAKVAKIYGFSWGGDWTKFPDYPHFQMTGRIPNVREAKQILFEKGLEVLWGMV